jgi:hypothetical protein
MVSNGHSVYSAINSGYSTVPLCLLAGPCTLLLVPAARAEAGQLLLLLLLHLAALM